MKLSWPRVFTIARREFLTTIRRKAFLFTIVGTPAYFGFIMWVSTSAEVSERNQAIKDLTSIGVVDSAGLYHSADRVIQTQIHAGDNPFRRPPPGPAADVPVQTFQTRVEFFPDQAAGEQALKAGRVGQLVVVPVDYVEHGSVRRYARSSSLFSSADGRTIGGWLSRGLVRGRVDSMVAVRAARPSENEQLFNLNRAGAFELKDDRRQIFDLMLPLMFSLLLGMCIVMGGQYLLQGVAEEKESRILESLLCTVSPEELMAGKLLGLGGSGLLLVAIWLVAGAALVAPALATLDVGLPPGLIVIAVAYFLAGYLFFGSLMIGIGALANTMREAQQFSVWFTFANFLPLIMFTSVVGRPNGPLAVILSMIPPTAPTAMMMRLTAPGSAIPAWQIALSLGLLTGTAWLCLIGAARVFRIGLLLYGKTPNLPEILRWARQG